MGVSGSVHLPDFQILILRISNLVDITSLTQSTVRIYSLISDKIIDRLKSPTYHVINTHNDSFKSDFFFSNGVVLMAAFALEVRGKIFTFSK